jgi:hypothetical protein
VSFFNRLLIIVIIDIKILTLKINSLETLYTFVLPNKLLLDQTILLIVNCELSLYKATIKTTIKLYLFANSFIGSTNTLRGRTKFLEQNTLKDRTKFLKQNI